MSPKKRLNIQFPMGGLVRSSAYQSQPPFTSPDCDNVRPKGLPEGRSRGGRRPGLVRLTNSISWKTAYTIMGMAEVTSTSTGSPVKSLIVARHNDTDGFLTRLSADETKTTAQFYPVLNSAGARIDLLRPGHVNMVQYLQKLYIANYGYTAASNPRYALAYDPNKDNGTGATPADTPLVEWGSTSSIVETSKLLFITLGKLNFIVGGIAGAHTLKLTLDCGYYRPGDANVQPGDTVLCAFRFEHIFTMGMVSNNPYSRYRPLWWAAAQHGFPTAATGGYYREGPPIEPTNVVPIGFQRDSDHIWAWTVLSVDGMTITFDLGGGATKSILDEVAALGTQVLKSVNIHVSIALKTTATLYKKGYVPGQNPLIAVYQDRIFLAGSPSHMWYACRKGDPSDWDMSGPVEDIARPIAGHNTDAGGIGDDLTAMIPWSDEYMVFGGRNSLWVMAGEPALGGEIRLLSDTEGMLSQQATTHGPAGEIIFMSAEGLYSLAPGIESRPVNVSKRTLPADLRNLDPTKVSVVYDPRDNAVHVFIAGGTEHWWIDWTTKTFWPQSFPATLVPVEAYLRTAQSTDEAEVLLAAPKADSHIRAFSDTQEADEAAVGFTSNVDAHVTLGPFRPGGDNDTCGILDVIEMAPDIPADRVIVAELFVAATAQAAVEAAVDAALPSYAGEVPAVEPITSDDITSAADASCLFNTGENYTWRPRRRATAVVIRVVGRVIWAFEQMSIAILSAGRRRKT